MENYSDECLNVFIEEQEKLFGEKVVHTIEEARVFLEECFAQVFDSIDEVREFLDEEGLDVTGVTDEELEEELEVFSLPDGKYLVVIS